MHVNLTSPAYCISFLSILVAVTKIQTVRIFVKSKLTVSLSRMIQLLPKLSRLSLVIILIPCFCLKLEAQQQNFKTRQRNLKAKEQNIQSGSSYSPAKVFLPEFYQFPGNRIRTAQGTPGPDYWQNYVNYNLSVVIDTALNTLIGSAKLTYTNNSPDSLAYLWLQLDQQTYKADARSNFLNSTPQGQHTAGYNFSSVTVNYNGQSFQATYIIEDTRMQIRLPRKLAPRGSTIQLNFKYSYDIPGDFGNRTDFFQTPHGKIYEIAQWYPRMCVYDDQRGWNTLPFLGPGEFYLEYGDIDYQITLPAGILVAGSGELLNEAEVLSAKELKLLNMARQSDETIMIRSAEDILKSESKYRKPDAGLKTWHFVMVNTRDVAFGASKAYIWDAARINLPDGKKSLAMSVYPIESAGSGAWGRATEYLKKSIEYFSATWYPYPYPVAINEAGTAGGMEYPGIVFDGLTDKGKQLFWVTAHEIGHNWFPMIVGSDERRFAWMDEGLNTFIDIYASDEINKGEFAPKRDGEYAPGGGNPSDEVIPYTTDPAAPTIMTAADAISEKYRHPFAYFKPAFGLVLLREQILGKDRFDYAFKAYIHTWAFKHPAPDDFFRSIENAGGEDLSWFWLEWFYHNWSLDQALAKAAYTNHDYKKGIDLSLLNLQQMVMPVTLEIMFKDQTSQFIKIPVETWLLHNKYDIHLPTTKEVKSVTLDPAHSLPDINRNNNTMSEIN